MASKVYICCYSKIENALMTRKKGFYHGTLGSSLLKHGESDGQPYKKWYQPVPSHLLNGFGPPRLAISGLALFYIAHSTRHFEYGRSMKNVDEDLIQNNHGIMKIMVNITKQNNTRQFHIISWTASAHLGLPFLAWPFCISHTAQGILKMEVKMKPEAHHLWRSFIPKQLRKCKSDGQPHRKSYQLVPSYLLSDFSWPCCIYQGYILGWPISPI